MALNDDAVLTAATGYVLLANPGTAKPSPAMIATFDPVTFGAEIQTVAITGSPTGGALTLTLGAQTTAAIPHNATAPTAQMALEALSNIGEGNVKVSGGPFPGTAMTVTFIGKLQGKAQPLMTATPSLSGGTSSTANVTRTTTVNGWEMVGHTAEDELPEWGFDGGDTETRGTWQKKVLKEVVTETAADYVTFRLVQFDDLAFALYYGVPNGGAPGVAEFTVKGTVGGTTEKGLLVVIVDGPEKVGFYSGKSSVRREDAISLATDEFGVLPLRATFLEDANGDYFSWIGGAIVGNPDTP